MTHYDVTFSVSGDPRPQGSKRHVGRGIMIESSKHLPAWRASARAAAVDAMQGAAAHEHSVRVEVCWRFKRPKSHYLNGRLRPEAPRYKSSRPDCDKLLRALLDSMTGVVYVDDAQVVAVHGLKLWSESSETVVGVTIL